MIFIITELLHVMEWWPMCRDSLVRGRNVFDATLNKLYKG